MIVAHNAIANHILIKSKALSLHVTWSLPIVGNSCRVAITTIMRTNTMKRMSMRMTVNKIMK